MFWENRKMKSIIKGINYLKIFTKGVYLSRTIKPVKKICDLPFGWKLYHVVRPKRLFGLLYDPIKMRELEMLCNVTNEDINTIKDVGSGEPIITYSCKSKIDDGYIGTPEDAWIYFKRFGLTQIQKADPEDNTCSIGFNEKEQKWYGWSHRAIAAFGIGDRVKEGDCTNSSGYTDEYLEEHPEADISLPVGFTTKTLEDARQMAIVFADSVS